MARSKKNARNKKEPKNNNDKKSAPTKQAEKANAASQKADEFLKNLGPKGYMKVSDSICKNVNIDDYSMSTPDGATLLLDRVSIKLTFGKRYGLVGKNGYGKTTLLKNMASYAIEDFPTHIRMVLVQQERNLKDTDTVIEAVLKSDVIRTQLLNEAKELEELMDIEEDEETAEDLRDKFDEITKHMEDLQIENSQAKAFRILTGLGFSKKMQKQQVCSLSGGWEMRVELAKALFVAPDLLLLDEPTNHLDFPAVLWLQEHLTTEFDKTLVLVSHDKMFLNAVSTNIIHLDHQSLKLDYYKTNYSGFVAARNERLTAIANEYRSYETQIRDLKTFIEKFRDKGEKRAAQVQSKLKTLKKLEESCPEPPREPKVFRFEFPEPRHLEQHLASMSDVVFGYSKDKTILNNVNLTVGMDSRVGVIGANGVGKSTLVKLLLRELTPDKGTVEVNPHARFTYFSQHHYEQLDMSTSAVEYFLQKFADSLRETPDRVQFVRRHLGRFGIKGDRQNQKIAYLSGGQKSRVAFAVMTFENPNFIVMDEPTNHLDIETVDALIEAISGYKGGVLVISHDTHFLSQIATEFWSVTREKIVRFTDFEEAKNFALQKRIHEIEEFNQ